MKQRSTIHSTFQIERIYRATPERVFAAMSNRSAKARWFDASEVFDFRVGGRELSRGGPEGGPIFTFDAYYQEIVPNERLVYSYSMDMNDVRISVSVATVELVPVSQGCKLVFTEQGAFFDGHDTPEQREHGTKELLNLLEKSLEESCDELFELVARRKLDAPRHLVYRAWTEPDLIARWWGPEGFTNTIRTFDPSPGGEWEFTMHGPDGTDYPNKNVFVQASPDCIVLRHDVNPPFTLTATFADAEGGGTEIFFRQAFETEKTFTQLKPMCEVANVQNLDRLEAVLREL